MGKKRERTLGGRIFRLVILLFNIGIAGALLAAFLTRFISPTTVTAFAYCGLLFPYLVVTNLFFVLFWLFVKYKYCLISLIVILLNVNNIDRIFQFHGMETPSVCENCARVMSYNAQLFGLYNSENRREQIRERDEILRTIRDISPDILCLQEFFYDGSGTLDFNTTDSLFASLRLSNKTPKEKKMHAATFFPVVSKNKQSYGLAIFSKYKIVHSGHITFPDSNTSNGAMFADIRYKNDTVRVYTIHLESFRLDPLDREVGKMIQNSDLNDPGFNKKALRVSKKMGLAFRKRAPQAEAIRAHIDQSPYPVIVCGDFNDPPVSYSYATVCGSLKDAFRTSGEGLGKTYHGEAFPNYRIDNILHNRKFSSYGYTVYEKLSVSDHYPIYADISITKR